MVVPVARASALLEIQRVRRIHYPGEVLVYEGQPVEPADIIAETSLPAEVALVEIANGLGVEMMATKDYLVREVGEYLFEGDMIAEISGTLPRLVRSPVTGRFTGLHQGKAVFEVGHRTIQVQAGLKGVVQSVIPEYGAVLATRGCLLQGVWGNGAIGMGELHVIKEAWSQPLAAAMLVGLDEGAVIAAGYCSDSEAIAELGAKNAAGLILGLMAPGLIQAARELSIPIIVLQGFGPGQPDNSLLDLLIPQAGKLVCLNAGEADRLAGTRPEAIIPLDVDVAARILNAQEELRVGQKVRVYSGQATGLAGEVAALPEGLTQFESSVQGPAAVIQLHGGETMTVPQHNLIISDDLSVG